MYKLLLLAILTMPTITFGQSHTITGFVKDERGKAVSGVLVSTRDGEQGTHTDERGAFTLVGLQKKEKCVLVVSHIQFQTTEFTAKMDGDQQGKVEIVLKESIQNLTEVQVEGKSEITRIKEQPLNISLLEGKGYYAQSSSTADLINRVSGIRVRQDGGFGSNANFSLNGISGKQIKFFIDGIPADFFGKGLGFNVVPVNSIERIEIYKGVVPVSLGADALGGALNLITRKVATNFVEAAYSYGSFNTHKSSLNLRANVGKKGLYLLANGFHNHSDNNYKIDNVPLRYEVGTPVKGSARRFHDKYDNYLARLELGIDNQKWADKLAISALYSGLYDEIQHPFAMFYYPDSKIILSEPYGQAVNKEQSRGATLTYHKKTFADRMSINVFAGLNYTKSHFTDTTLKVYRWDGKIERQKDQGGEISNSMNLLTLNSFSSIVRGNVSYQITDFTELTVNGVASRFGRSGNDPVAATYYGEDIFKRKTSLDKNTLGTSLKVNLLNGKLESLSSLKYFNLSADGFAVVESNKIAASRQEKSEWGWNEALKYSFSNRFLIKGSYERASRLPDELELLGNYYFIKPNKDLIPEASDNINLGVQYHAPKFSLEVNGFYRDIKDYIFLEVTRFSSQYKNLLQTRIKGIEGEVAYRPFNSLRLSANATYQDIRNKSAKEKSGTVDNRYYNSRLPNQPIFFANFEAIYSKSGLFSKNAELSVWWNANYVNWFYLYWATDGRKDTKSIIPTQFIQNIGTSYAFNKSISLSIEAFNILNQKAYDNFSVQKPGRSFSIKARYFLNLNSKINY